ncbi:sensor histidine kinase [Brevibacillus porteri]|uniref:histidine kinase n=1 Tax=Brevibacillus porteri TaxID=2126350 RepID=A0ABX5FTJ2_9BACL|nr:sensor histidine kinase [Brevibacillus porteri]ATF11283.1 sensor histidine kinase [Brevibacillus brevis X23]MED2743610.1 sensor histidine kinase [Brevibacillus porteri]MED2815168.1 sensor histidine kinase [Brevibacillus porteri]MED4893582.1 sensor histidine kinase [Brevibacillus porteri]PSK12616.1 sensor histidine kinase [Brevibacillus porteri]
MNASTASLRSRFLLICFFVLFSFFLIPTAYMHEPTIPFIITLIIIFCFLLMFLRPKKNWRPFQKDIAIIVLGTVSFIKVLYVGVEVGLSLPLVAFIGFHILERRRLYYAIFFGACSFSHMFFYKDYIFEEVVGYVVAYIGWYIGARGLSLQNQAKESSQQHLKQLQEAHVELQKAHSELQEASVNTLRAAVLEERTRIARDVHDALGHSLTSLIVQLNALKYMLQGGPSDAQEAVRDMLSVSKQSLDDIRSSVHTLAADKSSLGITPLRILLSRAQQHTDIKMHLISPNPDIPLSQQMTITLYRILQEAITNSIRHSNATEIFISIEKKQNFLFLSIWDNGNITNHHQIKLGFGLTGIAEQTKQLNGDLSYSIREPHGFQIDISFPLW